MFREAFWITNNGTILATAGNTNHIGQVIENPRAFGETRSSVLDEYASSNESMGFEGVARDVIIKRILARGFIRLRFYVSHWGCTVWLLNDKIKSNLKSWATTTQDIEDHYTKITIVEIGVPQQPSTQLRINSLIDNITKPIVSQVADLKGLDISSDETLLLEERLQMIDSIQFTIET